MLPNFIIAGAEKSGTSTLAFHVSRHPDVYMPERKELHFFENAHTFSKGIEWYRQWFAGWNNEVAVGECTPFYMYVADAAERIKQYLPDARLIFILRNPVDRAYSNYWHQVRGGKERLAFEDAIEREASRVKKGGYHNLTYSYLQKGFYSEQLKRFYTLFGPDQLLIVRFEDMAAHPQSVLADVFRFLGVDPLRGPQAVHEKKNRAIVPRFIGMQFFARRIFGRSIFFRAIARLNLKLGETAYLPMGKETRQQLNRYYSKEIESLERLTGVGFDAWK